MIYSLYLIVLYCSNLHWKDILSGCPGLTFFLFLIAYSEILISNYDFWGRRCELWINLDPNVKHFSFVLQITFLFVWKRYIIFEDKNLVLYRHCDSALCLVWLCGTLSWFGLEVYGGQIYLRVWVIDKKA